LLVYGVSFPIKWDKQPVSAKAMDGVVGTKGDKIQHKGVLEDALVPNVGQARLAVEPPMMSEAFVEFWCPDLGVGHWQLQRVCR
jgi:hypothetical protein